MTRLLAKLFVPRTLFALLALHVAGCASTATKTAAAPPKVADAKDDPVDRTIPSASPALARFDVPAADLPAGVTIGPGEPRCASIQPLTFFAQPATFGIVPKPLARRADVLRRGQQLVGSVLLFEYAPGKISQVRGFVTGLLWGEDGGPTAMHPEELVELGDTLAILCLDASDGASAWYRERLRTVHHARLPRPCPGLAAVQKEAAETGATEAQIPAVILRHREELMACSQGAAVLGEIAKSGKDYPKAEVAFRRAIELDAAGDALADTRDTRWLVHDGLALAVAMQGRVVESLPLFQRALVVAGEHGSTAAEGQANFNLACAYAELARFDDAATALQNAIALDPKHKDAARTDDSFKVARQRPAFQQLLK